MIDLHTHSLLSDGELVPAELARRAEINGYEYLGVSDHVDSSNIDWVVPRAVRAARELNPFSRVRTIPGAEITHVPPGLIGRLVEEARKLGAAYVVVHGETPVEPVEAGTNRAAIEAGANILAHPGLITEEEVVMARERGVYLEITARKGHSLTNGHVARLAGLHQAKLVLNTDAHAPSDLITDAFSRVVALGAGLSPDAFQEMKRNSLEFVKKIGY